MLELKNLSFAASAESGTVDILKHIDLTVEDGKFIVITGPNGGGKTTLAKAIMGLVTPTEGQIFWNGEDVTGSFHHRTSQARHLLRLSAAAALQGHPRLGPSERCSGQNARA